MTTKRRQPGFLRASVTYVTGEVVCRAVAFLYLPFVTRWLGPAEFGGLQLVLSLIAILVFISNLSMDNAVIRFLPEIPDLAKKKRFSSTVLVTGLATSIVFAVLLKLAAPYVVAEFSLHHARAHLLDVAILAIPSFQLRTTAANVLRAEGKPLHFNLITFSDVALGGALGVAALAVFGGGAATYLAGQVLGSYFSAGLALWLIRDHLTLAINIREFFRQAAAYSFPLMLLDAGALAFTFVDRFALAHWRDLDAVGIYALGAKVALPVGLVGIGVNRAFLPYVFALQDPRDPVRVQRVQRLAIAGLSAMVFLTVALARPIVLVAGGPKFILAADLAVLLVPVAAMQVLPRVLGVGFLVEKQTRLLSASVLIAAVLDVLLVLLLVPKFGVFGAATAALLSWGVAAAVIAALAPSFARPGRVLPHLALGVASCAGLWLLYRSTQGVAATSAAWLVLDIIVGLVGAPLLFIVIAGRGSVDELLRSLGLR